MEPEDNLNAINKNSRVVILKHMFTLKELEEDATLLLDLKEDVREECSTLGDVTNVVLYDVSGLLPLRCFIIQIFSTIDSKSRTA